MKTFDAQAALGFVISQTAHVEQQVFQIKYPDIQYRAIAGGSGIIDTSAGPFSKTVKYFSKDRSGQAEWINGNSDDVPLANTEMTEYEVPVYTGAIGYGWGWEEVEQAAIVGVPLRADYAMAARRAYEEFIDSLFLLGDDTKGFEGLFNNSNVPQQAADVGSWDGSGTTPDQIADDINSALTQVHTNTNTTALADTLLLPYTKFHLISTKRMTDGNESVLSYVQRNNVYTASTGEDLMIRGVRLLDDAGISNGPRMVSFRRAPDVMRMHLPMPLQFQRPFHSGPLRFEVPGVFRVGGLDIRLPQEVLYTDGI